MKESISSSDETLLPAVELYKNERSEIFSSCTSQNSEAELAYTGFRIITASHSFLHVSGHDFCTHTVIQGQMQQDIPDILPDSRLHQALDRILSLQWCSKLRVAKHLVRPLHPQGQQTGQGPRQ